MIESLLALLVGAVTWTLLEYLLHRFVFHSTLAKYAGAKEHRRHHALGDYFAPWWQKALAALLAIALVLPLFSLIAGLQLGAVGTAGFISMYFLYEILHRRAHTHPPRGRYGRWRRKNHFAHHFVDPRLAQGVTTPFWDLVFGTRLVVDRVRVPRRLAMRWLVDIDGEIHAEYTSDYTLVGSHKKDEGTRRLDTEAAMANNEPESSTPAQVYNFKN
jgi:sterol desaturase/sphingolipid hydroxylase (fatty acid hydroxylase superfamily)